ncbi:MAG TPA: GspE/PulE family protein [Candidatus Xenobia bacterium]|jgi:general secretion pathway protein E
MREVLERLPIDFLQRHRLLPIDEVEGRVRIGLCSRDSLVGLEDVRLLLERDVEPVFLSREEVDEGLRNLMVARLDSTQGQGDEAVVLADEAQDLMRAGSDAPVVQLVNSVLLKAIGMNASDVHVEPYEEVGVVRFRVDGVLQEGLQVPKSRLPAVIARIKVMARLNLAESRLPQDGRIKVKAGDHVIDLRVSTLPTLFGERVVLRLLRAGQLLSLSEIGLWPDDYQKLAAMSQYSYGMVLATGPTGSGKSTTLYGMMLMIQSPERNMITIEDPVEYQVARIGQIQVNARIGLTFAAGLRSILRQDPDVIMVGEIRDAETAEIAVHAALTGHLVLSTLHTNDAPTAVSRLMDMGVEGFLLSSSLLGVMAQRLVRKLCVNCRKPRSASMDELRWMGNIEIPANPTLYQPGGCPQCNGTGYRGRAGLFEIFPVTEDVRRLMARSGDAATLKQAARQAGMRTLMEDGARKALSGLTSIDEVLRATRG